MKFGKLIDLFVYLLRRPFYGMYAALYLVSCVVIYQTIEHGLRELNLGQVGERFAFALVGVSIIHIFLVYLSIHNIEESIGLWKLKYDGWVGKRGEIAIRWLIVILLMVFAGKNVFYTDPALTGIMLMVSLLLWDVLSGWSAKNLTLRNTFNLFTTQGRFFWSDLLGMIIWIAVYLSDSDIVNGMVTLIFSLYVIMISYRVVYFVKNGNLLQENFQKGEKK